ncbi:unnamed protein product [Calypogeia fissa]
MARMENPATNTITPSDSKQQQQQQPLQKSGSGGVAAPIPAPAPTPTPTPAPAAAPAAAGGSGGTSAAKGNQNGNNNNNNPSAGYNAQGGSSQPTTTTTAMNNNSTNSVSRPNGVTNGSEGGVLQLQLLHDPGVTAEWSVEEQATLDEGLTKFASETSNLSKYIKIANLLPEKTVRDVAMRCRWMTKKEIGKRRKPEDQSASKKSKDKKEKSDSLANKASQNNVRPGGVPTYVPPPPPVDNDDGISNDAIGGTTGQLLEQNSQIIAQIRSNLAACKLTENTDHLVRFRDNIFAILNGMTNMPGIMSQMPPLPVKLNTDLADTILPKSLQAPPPS